MKIALALNLFFCIGAVWDKDKGFLTFYLIPFLGIVLKIPQHKDQKFFYGDRIKFTYGRDLHEGKIIRQNEEGYFVETESQGWPQYCPFKKARKLGK